MPLRASISRIRPISRGQLWAASELGRAFGVADTTVRSYLDKLTDALVIRQLAPWHENLAKRQVTSPKIYMRDSGLLQALLGLPTRTDLERHPAVGASWERFLLEQVIARTGAKAGEYYFWRTYQGAELDLLVVRGRRRLGFEFKRTTAPSITPSMRVALADLKLDRLTVVHAGKESFPLAKNVRALGATDLAVERLQL